jgi:K+-transporting ATPase KdpF subunit
MTLFYWIVGGIALLLLLYLFAAMLKPELFS